MNLTLFFVPDATLAGSSVMRVLSPEGSNNFHRAIISNEGKVDLQNMGTWLNHTQDAMDHFPLVILTHSLSKMPLRFNSFTEI